MPLFVSLNVTQTWGTAAEMVPAGTWGQMILLALPSSTKILSSADLLAEKDH